MEIVELVNHFLEAALTNLNASTVSLPANLSSLVNLGTKNCKLWLDLSNDSAHDLASVDAHFDACFTSIVQLDRPHKRSGFHCELDRSHRVVARE